MLNPRIIPCLLIHDDGLVKTVKFREGKYVGDPINTVKLFNEKEVDEIVVLDIDASRLNKEPNYDRIEKLALECRMPLCYGGGIKSVEQARRIFALGVEKIAISSAAIDNPDLLRMIGEQVGTQSVVVVLDVKKRKFDRRYEIWTHNATINTKINPVDFVKKLEAIGVGEIVINSIDKDGVMDGYDLRIIDRIREAISVPLTVLGGAGTLDDIGELISNYGIIGASAGSLFVFKGVYKAVLVNYPNRAEKQGLIDRNIKTYLEKKQ